MDLTEELATFSTDPVGFVLWAFPWGEAGTELADAFPETWQMSLLERIRDGLITPDQAILEAVASGHGVGKSALIAWIILWAFSTRENTLGIVTANTQNQLRTKTWVALGIWFRRFIAKDMFELQATVLQARDPDRRAVWRVDQITWSEENVEAFQGLHNQGGRIVIMFDEGSAIPEKIWEAASGALTDANTQIIWCVFGNPTRNSGPFWACWHSPKLPFNTTRVDSRSVKITNRRYLDEMIRTYGIDSDYCRVRILGLFPRGNSLEVIGSALIEAGIARETPQITQWDPLIMAVDVARQGEDPSVIQFRRGLDARSIPPITMREANLMTLAGRIAELYREHRPDMIFVDEGGLGAGVVDRLRQLNIPVVGIQFGAKSDLPPREGEGLFRNKRSEMYGSVKRWLGSGGAIPDHKHLREELAAPHYAVNDNDEIILERKRDIKKRLGRSTDHADALALSFAYPVIARHQAFPDEGATVLRDYDPMEFAEVA